MIINKSPAKFFNLKSFTLITALCLLGLFSCKKEKKNETVAEPIIEEKFKGFSPQLADFKLAKSTDTALINTNKILLKRFFEQQWLANKVSAGLIVAKNGEIIFEDYTGLANRETGDSITANTPIHLASISKVFTAMLILKMVEEGLLNLDDKLTKFWKDFPYPEITVKHLLNHRSGLRNYTYLADDPMYWNRENYLTNKDALNIFIKFKPDKELSPGKRFSYSNTNYIFLALIIEEILEMSYPEAMEKYVFKPLKMNNTFVFELKDTARVSQSYTYFHRKFPFNHLDITYGDKNIYSTPRDLLKFDQAMYSPNFLKDSLKQMAFQGYSYETKGVKNYGLGMRMMEWPAGQKVLYHNGWWHGNYTSYVRANQDSVTVIALGNRKQRAVYSAFSIISLFGDYPLEVEGVDEDIQPKSDSLMLKLDSLEAKKDEAQYKPKKTIQKINEPKTIIDSLKTEETKDSVIVDSLQAL